MTFARGTEELRDGLWRLNEPLGSRLLSYYALRQDGGWLLWDAGLPGSITGRLDTGTWGGAVTGLIVSHADADHLGDAARLRERFPELSIRCHPADRAWIEDHDLLTAERYDHARSRYGYAYPDELLTALRGVCGDDFRVDATLDDGDTVDAAGVAWRVMHAPGHSPGHLCLWCEATGVLLLSDAALGRGAPDAAGRPSMPPTHQHVAPYLDTLDRLAALPVTTALPAHWEPLDGETFQRFIRESREVVYRDLATVEEAVRRGEATTFSGLMSVLNGRWSTWPESEDGHYFYALAGYLEHLEAAGAIRIDAEGKAEPA